MLFIDNKDSVFCTLFVWEAIALIVIVLVDLA